MEEYFPNAKLSLQPVLKNAAGKIGHYRLVVVTPEKEITLIDSDHHLKTDEIPRFKARLIIYEAQTNEFSIQFIKTNCCSCLKKTDFSCFEHWDIWLTATTSR